MTNDQLQEKIESISELLNLVDDTVKFHIGTMWAVIGVVLTIGLVIIPILARTWAHAAAEKKIKQIQDEIEKSMGERIKKLEDKSIQDFGSNVNGNYVRFVNGIQICTKIIEVKDKNSYLVFPASFTEVNNYQLTVIGDNDSQVSIIEVSNNQIDISSNVSNRSFQVSLFVIGKWK